MWNRSLQIGSRILAFTLSVNFELAPILFTSFDVCSTNSQGMCPQKHVCHSLKTDSCDSVRISICIHLFITVNISSKFSSTIYNSTIQYYIQSDDFSRLNSSTTYYMCYQNYVSMYSYYRTHSHIIWCIEFASES